ncbi:MAG: endonuclease/exonuclease/phosphatase family protein, partial [bacterium]|nr:endonuclease/exonuclease/phosphatase family protein [bacterium]
MMKKWFPTLTPTLMLIVLALWAAGCNTPGGQGSGPLNLRVMTFNIRNGKADDKQNNWQHRREMVCDVITKYSPDVLGLQEAFRFQLDEMNKILPDYGEIGTGRDGGTKGEYSAIYYRRNRFSVDESGTFWLSDTPAKPSKHWGNGCIRICTWARLHDRTAQRSFYVYNTHLDHKSQASRAKSVRLIMQVIGKRKHQDPFILTGDFNAAENNSIIKYLKGKDPADRSALPVVDTFRSVHPDAKVVGTANRFRG